jgi:hypothetical protein
MDIDSIKKIVNSNIPDESKRQCIIGILANDKDVIPEILQILNEERKQKENLILDFNAELSRALVVLKYFPHLYG